MKEDYRFKPKLSDLIDRLSIDILKSIFLPDFKEEYNKEIENILFDINLIIKNKDVKIDDELIHSIIIIALTNREIWLNESKARLGGNEQDKLLKFTHSLNGQRNNAKNIISKKIKDRLDLKIDCLAEEYKTEEFTKKHGNWDIWTLRKE